MSLLEKIYNVLDYQINAPSAYGPFHLASILIVALFLLLAFKNCDEKTERKIAMIFWIIIVVLEIYKQLDYSISFDEGKLVWDYRWFIFPFQFCSTPLYALPFIIFSKSKKVREAFISFIGTYSLFAGLAVFAYPNDVFISTLGIDIQTMVHHGSQVVLGIYFAVKRFASENPPKKKNWFLSATAVFSGFVITAMLMNIIVYNILRACSIDETFNMFYISPYFNCTLPVLSSIDPLVPYPVFLCIYIFGFAFVAFLVLTIVTSLISMFKKINYAHN